MTGCRPLTPEEIDSALIHLSDPRLKREKALFLLGIRTGLRLSCLLSLLIQDVSVNGKVRNRIRVRRASVKGRRAGFDLPLHNQAAQALQEYLDVRKKVMGYIFEGRYPGKRMSRSQGWRILKEIYAAAGLDGGFGELGAHAMRKTFCKNVFRYYNNDLLKTSRAMRHASVMTTILYLSYDDSEVDAGILAIP